MRLHTVTCRYAAGRASRARFSASALHAVTHRYMSLRSGEGIEGKVLGFSGGNYVVLFDLLHPFQVGCVLRRTISENIHYLLQ